MFCLAIDFVNIIITSLSVSFGNVFMQQLFVLILRYFIEVGCFVCREDQVL